MKNSLHFQPQQFPPKKCVRVCAYTAGPSTWPTCHSFAHFHTFLFGQKSVFVSAAASVVEGGAAAHHRVVVPPGEAVSAVARHWGLGAASWLGGGSSRLTFGYETGCQIWKQGTTLGKGKPHMNLVSFTRNGRMTKKKDITFLLVDWDLQKRLKFVFHWSKRRQTVWISEGGKSIYLYEHKTRDFTFMAKWQVKARKLS